MRFVRLFFTYALVAIFLFASFMKFSGSAMEVMTFQKVGLGMWFMYVTATLELLAAVLIVIRKYRLYGLLLGALVCAGAFVAQVTVLKMDWIHTVVLTGIALLLARYEYRARYAEVREAQ